MERDQSGADRDGEWYSPEDFREIAKSLGRSELPPWVESALRSAARAYLDQWLAEAPDGGRTLKDHHSALNNVIKLAEQIKHEFERLTSPKRRAINKARWVKDLTNLQQGAERVLETLTARGRLPRRARHHFVKRLAEIYEPLTSLRAGLIKHNGPCGPFYKFVLAALKPLALPREHPIAGIDKVISQVVRDRKTRQA